MTNTGQQTTHKLPEEMKGKYLLWTLEIKEETYSDGSVKRKGSYKLNQAFINNLPQSHLRFDEDSSLLDITDHFNNNVMRGIRVGVVARSFTSSRLERISTIKELRALQQSIDDLAKRPNVSIYVALRFKMMLEYYGFKDVLVDKEVIFR
ncbi:MAG: hypothetical protein GXP45_06160 [bacterium]|nr:hypothetical protein [bacterium]